MNDDQEHLAQALRTLAHREPATPAPVADLVRRGRRAKRTRAAVSAITGTAFAAAAVVVVLGTSGLGPAGTPSSAVPGTSAPLAGEGTRPAPSPRSRSLDARSFLLAAAETAAREPAKSGSYWYTRRRTIQPAHYTGQRAREKTPFSATVASTQESWYAGRKGARSRTMTGQDQKVTFTSPEDETEWKRLGSPDLAKEKPSTNDYDMRLYFEIGTHRFTVQQLLKLPTEKDSLEARLRRLFDEESASDWWPSKPKLPGYLWSAAQDLLAGPISPGTRSALYRLLAEQPGIKSLGEVTDPLGRTGIALTLNTADNGDGAGESRLIVDDSTAELLAHEFRPQGQSSPALQVTYEDMGWVDGLDERPQS